MPGHQRLFTEQADEELAAVLREPRLAAEDGPGRDGPKADDHLGPEDLHLRFEPGAAGRDRAGRRLLVETALPFSSQ